MATVNVNSITINSTSGSQGYGPFYRNNSIVSVDLCYAPWTLNIMNHAFGGCTNLKNVSGINQNVTNMYFTFDSCNSLVNAPVIPNSVTSLRYTFYYCNNLISAPVIPNSVTNMYDTFNGCSNLVNAPVIPNSVTNMYCTFYDCTKLAGNIYIHSENITHARACFWGTNALLQKNVYIPFKYANNVNTLTYNSFINADYDTIGTINGVWLKDIATL